MIRLQDDGGDTVAATLEGFGEHHHGQGGDVGAGTADDLRAQIQVGSNTMTERRRKKPPKRQRIAPKPGRELLPAVHLTSAYRTLQAANHALTDYLAEERSWFKKESNFQNFVMHCRRVTFMLQRLKGVEGFDEWYSHVEHALREDPVSRFFAALRTRIEHQEAVGLYQQFKFTTPEDLVETRVQLNPYGVGMTKPSVHVTDHSGVEQEIPTEQWISVDSEDLPQEHQMTDLGVLMTSHYQRLEALVKEAFGLFGTPQLSG